MSGARRPRTYQETVSEEASGLLRQVVGWEASEAYWARIDGAVTAMEAAIEESDPWTALDNAAAELELLGPPRVSTGLGDRPVIPAPPEVRERINKLITQLVRQDGQPSKKHQADGPEA